MRILITKSCFEPSEKQIKNILKIGTEVTLGAAEAKTLIEKGYAEEVKEPKAKEEAEQKPAKKEPKAKEEAAA